MTEATQEKTNDTSITLRVRPWRSYAYAALAFAVISIILFYPLTLNMNSTTPGSGGDSYQNLWDIWWVNYALFNLHTGIYHTSLLYWPVGVDLVFQTMSPLLALATAPLQALGVVFAYNIMFMLSFVLSGLAMMVLAKYVTKNSYAAFFAGVVFSFSSFHIASAYAHIHFVNVMWIPLFMYFLLRSIREERRLSNVLGMSASFAFSALMGSMEQTIMLVLVLALTILGYLAFKRARVLSVRFGVNLLLFVIAAFVLGAWLFIPIIAALTNGSGLLSSANYLNDAQHNEFWSADLMSFFTPSYYNGIFHWLTQGTYSTLYAGLPAERTAYLSFTALLLAAYCIYRQGRRAALWIAGVAVFGLISLGPQIEFFGSISSVPGPYYLYHAVPYLNIIREPGRFSLVTTMFLAVLAAMGVKLLLERWRSAKRGLLGNSLFVICAVSALFLIESNGMPLFSADIARLVTTQVSVPTLYSLIAQMPGNFSVLQLPTQPAQNSNLPLLSMGKATYYTSITRKPLVGGYVTRSNLTDTLSLYNIPLVLQDQQLSLYGNLSYSNPVVENYTNQTLLTLFNYDTKFIVLDRTAYNNTSLAKLGTYLFGVFGSPVYTDNTTIAFATSKAINASLFRSYVSYPIPTQWQASLLPFNGTYRQVWMPVQSGAVVVYAPFANLTDIAGKVGSRLPYSINTTIRINALSPSPQTLYVVQQVGNSTRTLAQFNVTGSMHSYELNVTLASGQEGNMLFFLQSNSRAPLAVANITFSRRTP